MKYPPALLTAFLAALPQKAPISFGSRSLISQQGTPLSADAAIACSLLNSLACLFATPLLCFQSLAASFAKIGGMGVLCAFLAARLLPSALREGQLHFCSHLFSRTYKSLPAPCPPTPLFIFSHLRIPWRASPFFSHRYKLPGCHPLKAFSVLSVPSVVSVLNSFLRPLPITI